MFSHINSLFNSVSYRIGHILVDPGDEWDGFFDVKGVLLSHGHFDHIYGLNRVVELNPQVRIFTNEEGVKMIVDPRKNMSLYHETPFSFIHSDKIEVVEDEEILKIEDLQVSAMFTPGHHPSCITWLMDDCLFSGDSYIPGLQVVTNLPRGNKLHAEESMQRILQVMGNRTICPGHPAEFRLGKDRHLV